MKRLFSLILTLITLSLSSAAFCIPPTNTLTLSSYYPAPFGAYESLRLVPRADLADPCNDGSLYFKDSNDTLQICRGSSWTSLTGLWSMTSRAPGFDPSNPSARVDQYYLSTPYPDLTIQKPFLGIGTDNPQRPLHIVADDSGTPEAIIIENLSTVPNSGASISFHGVLGGAPMKEYVSLKATYQDLTAAAAESSLSFLMRDGTGTGIKEQFTFKGNGFLGVRDPNPSAVLELAGNAITGPPAIANTLPYMMISTNQVNTGDVLTILANGNVGINQTLPTEKLEVIGNIKATQLILTSDANLKKNIRPVANALDKISQLNGVSFEWKDTSTDQRQHMGVLAQDVERIFPESVYGQAGAKGVDYPSLIAPLIEAVKELKVSNETLEQELQQQSMQIHQNDKAIESLQNALSAREPALAP